MLSPICDLIFMRLRMVLHLRSYAEQYVWPEVPRPMGCSSGPDALMRQF